MKILKDDDRNIMLGCVKVALLMLAIYAIDNIYVGMILAVCIVWIVFRVVQDDIEFKRKARFGHSKANIEGTDNEEIHDKIKFYLTMIEKVQTHEQLFNREEYFYAYIEGLFDAGVIDNNQLVELKEKAKHSVAKGEKSILT